MFNTTSNSTRLATHLLHEEDEDLPEDLDEVDEEVEGVGDEVLVAVPCLPDDHLGVEHDEPTEDGQANVEVCLQYWFYLSPFVVYLFIFVKLQSKTFAVPGHLEEELGPEEDVEEAEDEEGGEAREERAAEVEVLTVGRHKGRAREAGEDRRGEHEGRGHQGGVHHDGHGEEGAHAQPGEEGEGHEHGDAHAAVLAVVGGHEEAEGEAGAEK